MSDTIKSKLRVRCEYSRNVKVDPKKLEIRPSSNVKAGLGVFALEFIPAETIFFECINHHIADTGTIDKKINDLAYQGQCCDYDTLENIQTNINVGYLVKDCKDEWMSIFGNGAGVPQIYLYALKDIHESEELSRYYGLNYWLEKEFWDRFPDNKYRLTQAMEDLPSDWVFVDEIRLRVGMNTCSNLFAKKVSDKYHYFVSTYYLGVPDYFDPQFADKLNDIIIITKNDYSPYQFDEIIYDSMYLTRYLTYLQKNNQAQPNQVPVTPSEGAPSNPNNKRNLRDHKCQFFQKYPQCNYSKYDQNRAYYGIPIVDDIPPAYIPSTFLYKDGDRNLKKHYLYCKKVEESGFSPKYYYLLDLGDEYRDSSPDEIHYYDFDFAEKLLSFVDVTKPDFTQYQTHDCILGNMHTMENHDIQLDNKIKKKRMNKQNFWKKHAPHVSDYQPYELEYIKWDEKIMGDYPSEYVIMGHVQHNIKSPDYYHLYVKKIDNKYYYLIGKKKQLRRYYSWSNVQYYDPEFVNKIPQFQDATKIDYSPYKDSDCILGNLYFKSHLIKLALND